MARPTVYPTYDKCQCYFCNIKKDPSKKGKGRSVIELHHIKEKSDGGDNHPANLIPVCSNHHSLIHEGWIKIEGWFFSTKGWVVLWEDHEGNKYFGKPKTPYMPLGGD